MTWEAVDLSCNAAFDETRHFGSVDQRSNPASLASPANSSALFNLQTKAQFRSTSTQGLPVWCGASNERHTCIALDAQVYIFSQACSQLEASLDLEHHVTHLAWGGDTEFLVIADAGGAVHLMDASTKRVLLSQVLLKPGSGDRFITVAFHRMQEQDAYEFFVVTAHGRFFRFANVNLQQLRTCIANADLPGVKQVKSAISLQREQLLSAFDAKTELVGTTYAQFFTGEAVLMAWTQSELVLWAVSGTGLACMDTIDVHPFIGADIVACHHIHHDNNDYLLLLDSGGALSLWLASALIMVSIKAIGAENAYVVPSNDVPSGFRVAVMTESAPTQEHVMRLLDIPALTLAYALPVANQALILAPRRNNTLMLLEATKCQDDDVTTVFVRALEPTIPRDRFYHLLQKGRYEDALALTKDYSDLSPNTVHEVHVNNLLDALERSDDEQTKETLVQQLMGVLDHVKDLGFVVQSAVNAAAGSTQQVHTLLAYAHARLDAFSTSQSITAAEPNPLSGPASAQENDHADEEVDVNALNAQVLSAMNRLTTFQLAAHGKFNAKEWLRFMDADLYKELLVVVSGGRIGTASILWYRHMREYGFQEQMMAILSAIPDMVPSSHFLTWYEHDLVPNVMRQDHSFVIDWVRRRCLLMEVTERDTWPRCALDLILASDELLVMYGCSQKPTSLAVRNMKGSYHPGQFVQMLCSDRQQTGKQSAQDPATVMACELAALRTQLEDIEYLQQQVGFDIGLSDYLQSSPTTIMIKLLDRTAACELMADIVRNELTPYAERHKVALDAVLEAYVTHLASLQRAHGSAVLSNSWTGKALAIIPCIQEETAKVRATIQIMRSVWVPCSRELLELFEEARAWPAASTQEFQEHYRILNLKTMLLPYGVANENLSNVGVARNLIKVILSNFEVDSAIDDALQVVAAYKNLSPTIVFVIRIRNLCVRHALQDACELFQSLPDNFLVSVCSEVVSWVLEICAHAADYEVEKQLWHDAVQLAAEVVDIAQHRLPPTTLTCLENQVNIIRAMRQGLLDFGVVVGALEFETTRGKQGIAAKFLKQLALFGQQRKQHHQQTSTTTMTSHEKQPASNLLQSPALKIVQLRQHIQCISKLLDLPLSDALRLVMVWALTTEQTYEYLPMVLDMCDDIASQCPSCHDTLNLMDICERLLHVVDMLASQMEDGLLHATAMSGLQLGVAQVMKRVKTLCDHCLAYCPVDHINDAVELVRCCTLTLNLVLQCEHHNINSATTSQEQKETSSSPISNTQSEASSGRVPKRKKDAEADNGMSVTRLLSLNPPHRQEGRATGSQGISPTSHDGRKTTTNQPARCGLDEELRTLRRRLRSNILHEEGLVLERETVLPNMVGFLRVSLPCSAMISGGAEARRLSQSSAGGLDAPFSTSLVYEQRRVVGRCDSRALEGDDVGPTGDQGVTYLNGLLSRAFQLFEMLCQSNHAQFGLQFALEAIAACAQYKHLHTEGAAADTCYWRALPVVATKVAETHQVILRACMARQYPDLGLAVSCLSLLSVEEGFAAVRRGIKASRQHYQKLASLALLGCGGAILWKSVDIFNECTELQQNAEWWAKLSNLNVPIKREQFSRDAPAFEFNAILEHSDFDLSLCLDLAEAYNVSREQVYQSYISTLCLTSAEAALCAVLPGSDSSISSKALHTTEATNARESCQTQVLRADLKENALYMIQLLQSPETLGDVITKQCLSRINPYDYERIEFALELLQRVSQRVRQLQSQLTTSATTLTSKRRTTARTLRPSASGRPGMPEAEHDAARLPRVDMTDAAEDSQGGKAPQEPQSTWDQAQINRARLVLGVLTRFTRQFGAPSEELHFITETLGQPLTPMHHALSRCRLPFHQLFLGDALEVLKPELTLSSIEKLLPLARLLNIHTDDIYTAVIGEALSRGLELTPMTSMDAVFSSSDFTATASSRFGQEVSVAVTSTGLSGKKTRGATDLFSSTTLGLSPSPSTPSSSIAGVSWLQAGGSLSTLASLKHANTQPTFENVMALLRKLESAENSAACAKEVADVLPVGQDKVVVLEFAVDMTDRWLAACTAGDDRSEARHAAKAKERFMLLLRETQTLHLLSKARIQDAVMGDLIHQPGELIVHLFEQYTVGTAVAELMIHGQALYKLASAIGELHGVDVESIRLRLIEEYLKAEGTEKENQQRPSRRQGQASGRGKSLSTTTYNATTMMATSTAPPMTLGGLWGDDDGSDASVAGMQSMAGRSFAGHQTVVHETLETADEATLSLHRAIALLRMVDVKDSALFLINFAMVEGSTKITLKARVRACIALFSITTLSYVATVLNQEPTELQEHFLSLIYTSRLEDLDIYQTPLQFERTNKQSIVKSIMRNRPTDPVALELVVHLCLDFDVYDLGLWERILNQVMSIGDYELLANVLVSVAGSEELWYLASLEKAWQATLKHFVARVEDVNDDCEKAIRLMLKSPLSMRHKAPVLVETCMNSNKEHLAIVCAFCHAEANAQLESIRAEMNVSRVERCLSVLQTSTLPVLDKVKHVLERWLIISQA
eukprot:m.207694 g.207694  ORF g.207694 m.207694 type:complete len:2531 (+) comp16919_c0_seq8:206-7798(+)